MKIRCILFTPLFLLIWAGTGWGQGPVLPDSLFRLARANSPLTRNDALITGERDLNLKSIRTATLPSINLNGQATWQTDVTSIDIPFPGINIPTIPHDQYKLALDVRQIIYDWGRTDAAGRVEHFKARSEILKNETDLYPLYESICELYFNYLLLRESRNLLDETRGLLLRKEELIGAAVEEGLARISDLDNLVAARLGIEQEYAGIGSRQNMIIEQIYILTSLRLTDLQFVLPPANNPGSNSTIRPEYQWFDSQKALLDVRIDQTKKNRLPSLFAFTQFGYARPGLNMFSEDFDTYVYAGVGLSWSVTDWGNTCRQSALMDLKKESLTVHQDLFTRSMELRLTAIETTINNMDSLLAKEESIILIRERILQRSQAGIDQGVVPVVQFLDDLSAMTRSKINRQKLLAEKAMNEAFLEIVSGNINLN